MQINPANQTADFNAPVRANSEKAETPAAVVKQIAPPKETQDQIEVKDAAPVKNQPVETQTSLKFTLDQQTKQLVVELVNNKTGEAIRQSPSEVSLKLTAIYAGIQGKLVNKKC